MKEFLQLNTFLQKNIHYAIALLLFFITISPEAVAEKSVKDLSRIETGIAKQEVRDALGEPQKIDFIERHLFSNWGQVVVKDDKIYDLRIIGQDADLSPLSRQNLDKESGKNKLRYLRIGSPVSEISSVAGNPDLIINGEDWIYNNGQSIVELTEGTVTAVVKNRETGLARLDWVKLNFSPGSLFIMNITLAFIMFGVALEIKPENFKQVFKEPKSIVLGIFSQFLALPAITFLLIYFISPTPSVALGMILVAACPGGNISNFISSQAKANTALSISLTAFATVAAVIMTPINFAFWGGLYSETANMIIPIRIDFFEMLRTVLILLGIPVVLGIWFAKSFPKITQKIIKPTKKISMIIFLVFVVMALLANIDFFRSYIHLIIFIVLAHNALALFTGFSIGTLGKLPRVDRRSITIETGIQNSGLGLVLIFNPRLFDGLGGMAFIAAWWGIWHIISGLLMAYFWSKKPLHQENVKTVEVGSKD